MTQKKSLDSKTWMYIGAGVLAVIVVVLVAISAAGGGDDKLQGVDDAKALVADIPSDGFFLGKESAPVTVIEFLDLQCPHCAAASTSIVPDLIERHVRNDGVRLQMQPLAIVGNTANGEKANRALYAAGQQGKAWLFAEILYRNQGAEGSNWLDDSMVTRIAEATGLDMAKFDTDRNSAAAKAVTSEGAAQASAQSVTGTPTFIARNKAGTAQVLVEDTTSGGFDAAIAAVSSAQ